MPRGKHGKSAAVLKGLVAEADAAANYERTIANLEKESSSLAAKLTEERERFTAEVLRLNELIELGSSDKLIAERARVSELVDAVGNWRRLNDDVAQKTSAIWQGAADLLVDRAGMTEAEALQTVFEFIGERPPTIRAGVDPSRGFSMRVKIADSPRKFPT